MLPKMIAVNQFIQIIGRFGMIRANMRHFRVGFFVNQMIQKKNDANAQRDGADYNWQSNIGFNGLNDQIKAYYAQHDPAGKTQKQADSAVGVLLQHRADQSAQTGSSHAGNGSSQDQSFNDARKNPSVFASVFQEE